MRRALLACLFAASLLALPVPALATCVRTVRWEAAQPPYNQRLADGRQGGYYADLVVEVLRRMGCQARLVEMRWPRGLVELEAGRIDIMAGMLRTPEREAFTRFTRSINLSPNRLYLSGSAQRRYPVIRSLADLRSTTLTIGVESSAVYGPAYVALQDDPMFRARLYFVPTQRTGWQMLAGGRLDGLISDDVRARLFGLPTLPREAHVRAVLTVAEAPADRVEPTQRRCGLRRALRCGTRRNRGGRLVATLARALRRLPDRPYDVGMPRARRTRKPLG